MTSAAAELHDAAALNSPDLQPSILDLTVFVSCYNESQYIANTLDNVRTALAEVGKFAYEIVVIDDCSMDESPRAILDYLNRYPHERILFRRNLVNIGWAQNYIDAAFIGCGKYFRVVCGDESEPKQTMIDVFNHIGEADILVPYYASSEGRSLYRLTMSWAYTALVNLLSGFHLRYYNGLHVHLRYNVMRWHSNTRGFGFQADILCLLLEQGFSYKEIPVVTIERKKGRSTALSFRNILSVSHICLILLSDESPITSMVASRVPRQNDRARKTAINSDPADAGARKRAANACRLLVPLAISRRIYWPETGADP